MCVVLVKTKYGNSNIFYSTFAMLDNCSQECFIQACLVKKLRMRVQRNSINFKVLTGEESHPTVAIKGLKVCSRLGSNKERINIPNFFTKDLPVDSNGFQWYHSRFDHGNVRMQKNMVSTFY